MTRTLRDPLIKWKLRKLRKRRYALLDRGQGHSVLKVTCSQGQTNVTWPNFGLFNVKLEGHINSYTADIFLP